MLNKAILMGRLTADPELRHTPNNVPVLSFTIAVDRAYSKDGRRETDFLDIVAWRSTAEFIARYFRKGQMIAVTGSVQARIWEDKEGKKRKNIEIIADDAHFTESKKSSSYQGEREGYSSYGAPQQPQYENAPAPADDPSDFQEISDEGELPF